MNLITILVSASTILINIVFLIGVLVKSQNRLTAVEIKMQVLAEQCGKIESDIKRIDEKLPNIFVELERKEDRQKA